MQEALLTIAADDSRGLPDPETLECCRGYKRLRSERNGRIKLSIDRERMWVEVERK